MMYRGLKVSRCDGSWESDLISAHSWANMTECSTLAGSMFSPLSGLAEAFEAVIKPILKAYTCSHSLWEGRTIKLAYPPPNRQVIGVQAHLAYEGIVFHVHHELITRDILNQPQCFYLSGLYLGSTSYTRMNCAPIHYSLFSPPGVLNIADADIEGTVSITHCVFL